MSNLVELGDLPAYWKGAFAAVGILAVGFWRFISLSYKVGRVHTKLDSIGEKLDDHIIHEEVHQALILGLLRDQNSRIDKHIDKS